MDIEQEARKIIARSKLAVSGDGGHNTTFAVACTLAKLSGEEETLMRWLRAYNERLDEQWTERELYHKAEGAVNAVSRTRKPSRPRPTTVPLGKSRLWKPAAAKTASTPIPSVDHSGGPGPGFSPPPLGDAGDAGDEWSIQDLYTPPRYAYAYAGTA